MWLKMCPKCGGDLYLRDELDCQDIVCLQCGHSRLMRPEDTDQLEHVGLGRPEKRAAA